MFVYEHLSGGLTDAGADASDAAELAAAGAAMRDAVVADLLDSGFDVGVAAPGDGGEPVAAVAAVATAATVGAVGVGAEPARPRRLFARPGESAVDVVARESARHDLAWVIAPETGGWLARLCAACAPARWLGCRADAITLAGSKRATLQRLAEHGVCTPLAFATDASTRRWVVKPDDGAGALATRRHCSAAAAAAGAAARPGSAAATVVEPWVDGRPLSLSLLCSARGSELLSVNRQLIGVDATGVVSLQRVEPNVLAAADPRSAPLHALARRVGEAIGGLRGFVGVDLVWHAQRGPVVIEVNPRVTTAYVGLPQLLGRSLAADVVAAHLEEQQRDWQPGVR